MRNKNNTGITALILILLAMLGYAAYAYSQKSSRGVADTQVVCTMDAMECPDGTYVGRTGPDCQFICPVGSIGATTTGSRGDQGPVLVEVKLNEAGTVLGEKITPISIVEDSRCPIDVMCIQAGTVRLATKIESSLGDSTQTITVGTPVTTESAIITLMKVTPDKNSKIQINASDYRFTFQVTKR